MDRQRFVGVAKGREGIVGMAGVRLLAGFGFLFVAAAVVSAGGGPRAALVVTAPVESRPLTEELSFAGTVYPVRESIVASELAGLVDSVEIDEGKWFRRGEKMISLDQLRIKRALETAQAELGEVEARLLRAEAEEARSQELIRKKIVAQERLDQDVANRAVLESQKRRAEAILADLRDDLKRGW